MAEKFPSRPGKKARNHLCSVLRHALEEEIACSTTVRNCLRSLTGPNFHSLNRLFREHSRQIDCWLGEIVERTRAIGAAVISGKTAPPAPSGGSTGGPADHHVVAEMVTLHEGVAARLRQDAGVAAVDPATAELLARLVEFHETTAWMLRMVRDGGDVPAAEH